MELRRAENFPFEFTVGGGSSQGWPRHSRAAHFAVDGAVKKDGFEMRYFGHSQPVVGSATVGRRPSRRLIERHRQKLV